MAPVEDPEAKVRMRVESPLLEIPCPRPILTRSKWCFDPTSSLTKLLVVDLGGEAGGPEEEVKEKIPAP